MDIMNMTIAQLIESAEKRNAELANEIALYERIEREALELREFTQQVYELKPNETTKHLLDAADDSYWEKSNHLYQLGWEQSQLTNLIRSFRHIGKCERIYQVADTLGM